MSLCAQIGWNIRMLRLAKGWSQEKLAMRAGLSVNFVGNLERGRANVSVHSLERIATQLGVGVGDILRNEERSESGSAAHSDRTPGASRSAS